MKSLTPIRCTIDFFFLTPFFRLFYMIAVFFRKINKNYEKNQKSGAKSSAKGTFYCRYTYFSQKEIHSQHYRKAEKQRIGRYLLVAVVVRFGYHLV